MPKVRSPNIEAAQDLFKKGYKLKDIASQLGVAEGTVRSWKKRYNWESATQHKNKCNVAKENNKNNRRKKDIKKPIEEEVKEVLENADITDKQRLFCAYYIKSLNATQSYMKAYQCSYDTAMVEGFKTLRNPKIKEKLQELKDMKINSILVDKYDVLEFLGKALKADMNDFQEERDDGIYKKSNCDGTLIHSIKEGKYGIEIKLYDKTKIVEMLINILGITPKDIASIMQIEANTKLLNVKAEEVEGRLF
ncbi:terminase small subunit [Clostridium perfringens]|uniref:terminase small subunit n=1 Tax=Clostridium perfringens TaxID=1502 RepID=UPI00189A6E5C|nr:terminase small subunit [Clostridium perfringens]